MQKILISLIIVALVWAAPQDLPSGNKASTTTTVSVENTEKGTGSKCSLANGSDGICTRYYKCNDAIGTESPDYIYSFSRSENEQCESYLDLCCLPQHIIEYPNE